MNTGPSSSSASSSSATASFASSSSYSSASSTSSFSSSSFTSLSSLSSFSSSSSLPFSYCSPVADQCLSRYTESIGYCCSNNLCDPYQDCSFGANYDNAQNNAAAISTTTLLFSLCAVLFVYLLYRRWRLRREYMSQLRYLAYLDAAASEEQASRMAAAGALGVDHAVELSEVRPAPAAADEGEAAEEMDEARRPAAGGGAGGQSRGGRFKAFTGRAFKLGEYDALEESAASRNSSSSLSREEEAVDEYPQHSVDVPSDAEEDEKAP